MSKKRGDEDTIEYVLGQQLASDQMHLLQGITDSRRLTRINETQAFCIAYFLNVPEYRGGQWLAKYVENFLNLRMGVDGWRANQLIKLVAGAKGTPTINAINTPGWFGRNFSRRDWKQKATLEGETEFE